MSFSKRRSLSPSDSSYKMFFISCRVHLQNDFKDFAPLMDGSLPYWEDFNLRLESAVVIGQFMHSEVKEQLYKYLFF